MQDTWVDILVGSFWQVAGRLTAILPRVLAALTLVVIAWALAALARRAAKGLLRAADVDGRCARWGVTANLKRTGVRHLPSDLVGGLVFWIIVVVGLLMGIEALEMPMTVGFVPVAIRFLPNLIVAVLVMVIGWLLANFLAQAVLIFMVNAQLSGGSFIAGTIRWLVLAFAGAVALTQLDIAREMVLLVFGITFGGSVLALALAFGLGGRDLAREVLESWVRRRRDEEESHISHV